MDIKLLTKVISRSHCGRVWVAIVTALVIMVVTPLSASEAPKISLTVGKQVVLCEAGPVGDGLLLRSMLQQGASVTVKWVFSIARVRSYWLNEDAGQVVVTRVVSSDLISRQWRLRDQTVGVVTETNNANQAVRFLSYLDSFPLIDRSLLVAGQTYQVSLQLHIRDSDQPQAWWQRWVDFGKTVLTQRFTLPAVR